MKNWFQIEAKASGVLDISIHDEIGLFGVSAEQFLSELGRNSDAQVINLSIHSPGGNVMDALAMHNALSRHSAEVYATVEGIAASAASVILMAADKIAMPEDSYLMIHNAWTMAMGDAEELRDVADVLEKFQNTLINIYQRRTDMEREQIAEMMSAETWLTADEALALGFADTVTRPMAVAAKITNFEKYFKALPVQAEAEIDKISEIDTLKDFESYLRDAGGFSRKETKALVSRGKEVLQRDVVDDESETAELEAYLNKIRQ